MKLRKSLLLIAVMALLTALTVPLAQAGEKKGGPAGKKAGPGKKGTCKQASGKKGSKGAAQKRPGKKGKGQKKGGCKKNSGKKKGPGKVGASAPDCGNPGGSSQCYIDVTVNQGSPLTGAICDSFDNGSGVCIGSSTGTAGWRQSGFSPKYGIGTWFTWDHGSPRDVEMLVKASFTITESFIRGNVPSGGSATFNVTDAWSRYGDAHWKTVSTGGSPGTPGGPLYIDYEHRTLGSYVHMFGYLVRK